MDKLYKKKANGRYKEVGYVDVPDLYDGIWLVQNRPGSRSKSSLVWRVGDIKRPVDITTLTAFLAIADEVASYIVDLTKPDSKECKDAKKELGGWNNAPENQGFGVYNISASDYANLILRKIATYFEDVEDPPSLYEITRGDFMKDNPGFYEFRDKLEKYLRENNFVIKKR
jgi:hypothetical protein